MDQYIKKKKKPVDLIEKKVQNEDQIRIRQTKQQVNDLINKLKYIDSKSSELKKSLMQINERTTLQQVGAHQKLLVTTQSLKPSITNQVFNGKTQKSNNNILQTSKLGITPEMVDSRNATTTLRQTDDSTTEKFQQPSKGIVRKRRSRI